MKGRRWNAAVDNIARSKHLRLLQLRFLLTQDEV